MRKFVILAIATGLLLSSCLPASATNIPGQSVDLNATAAVFVQQTLQALPSATSTATNTPVVVTETITNSPTSTIPSETVTPNQTSTTGTITVTGTLTTSTATVFNAVQTTNTPTSTITVISNSAVTATETLHPRFYGTLPPNVPYNSIELVNKSKAEAYISLQVTVADGSTTILEYPVGKLTSIQVPVGRYKYVAWVGGKKMIGSFALGANNDLRITINKNSIEVKAR